MTRASVKAIADAVLYEGYVLYPYRPSAIKNRQRWTFGGAFPQAFSSQTGGDPWTMETECLLESGVDATVTVEIRLLQIVTRDVLQRNGADFWRPVPRLDIGGRIHIASEEAIEREVAIPPATLGTILAAPLHAVIAFPPSAERETLREDGGEIAGAVQRTTHALQGSVTVSALGVSSGIHRLRVRLENTTPLAQHECENRALAQRGAFAATHAVLHIEGGNFISQIDPPTELAAAAAACLKGGWWPVLVGAPGTRDTMLAAPIILYDHPEIAPESPGDLFDGTEIDEILTLRILTMTDAEKREAAAADPRVRDLLARTEALTAEDMARLHGALRAPRPYPKPELAAIALPGRDLCVGARVRLKPRAGGDVMDIVLAGQIAIIEAIERDFEDRIHVAVTLEDDPGRDFGLDRFPGHRFFFAAEELEPIAAAP